MNRYVTIQTDRLLADRAGDVAADLRAVRGPMHMHRIVFPGIGIFTTPGVYLQLVDTNGTVLAKSESLGSESLPCDRTTLALAASKGAFFQTVRVNGEQLRIYNLPLLIQGTPAGLLQAGQSLHSQNLILTRLVRVLFIAGLFALVLAAALGLLLAGLALQPVRHLTRVATAISETRDLTKRVDYQGPPDEIGELTGSFNRMLERLESAHHSLEEAYSAQRRFVGDVSHELRTPLTTIRGNLELLQCLDAGSVKERREILDDVVGEVERLVRLVQNLLTFARAEAGRHIDKETVHLGEVVREVARQAPLLGEAGFTGERLDLLQGAEVAGNADYLKQLLLILLDNAFKYTPASGQITLRGMVKEGWWGIQVRDTGKGIPPGELNHIFDRFYRGANARAGGTGLGLSIAAWIVKEHDGQIEVSSRVGEGSAFTVWLPQRNTRA